jgi:hypothetical protein
MNCAQFGSAKAGSNFPQKNENGRIMPSRGTAKSPVPNRGTPPLRVHASADRIALIPNDRSHSVHTRSHWFTIKKIPREKSGSSFLVRPLNQAPSRAIHAILFKTFGHSKNFRLLRFVTPCYTSETCFSPANTPRPHR